MAGANGMECVGCEVRDRELTWLREQYQGLLDRFTAAVTPAAYAQVRGQPLGQSAGVESFVDDKGQAWVTLNGQAVKLEDYQKLLREASGVQIQDGTVVPKEEYDRAMGMLDSMVGGRPAN